MKKTILTVITIALISQFQLIAQSSSLIHYWHFNNTLPAGGGGGVLLTTSNGNEVIHADSSAINKTSAFISFVNQAGAAADTGICDNLLGDTTNQRITVAAANNNAIRTRNPSDKMDFIWTIPTTGYTNIIIKYATETSSTSSGQTNQNFSYSLDGINFITTDLKMSSAAATAAFGLVTVDLSNIVGASNNPNLKFKIDYTGNNTGTKGNNRYDNITVEGTKTITGLNDNFDANNNLSVFPIPAKNILNISIKEGSISNLTISSILGEVVILSQINNNVTTIDISSLVSGIYILNITDDKGSIKNLKFVKE